MSRIIELENATTNGTNQHENVGPNVTNYKIRECDHECTNQHGKLNSNSKIRDIKNQFVISKINS